MNEEQKNDVAVCIQKAVAKDANERLEKNGLTCSVEASEVSVAIKRRSYLVAFDVYVTNARDFNRAHYAVCRTVGRFTGARCVAPTMVKAKSSVDEDTLEKGWSIEAEFDMDDDDVKRCLDGSES